MATLKREVKKLPSESNLRLLSSLIVSIANKQSSLEDKCIAPWKADETYQKDISYVSHNGYVYICSVTNQDSVFTESHWTKLADEFTELDVDTIKSYLNLTQEQITTLQSLIDDTTITTTKTNSSSKIYMDIQAAITECKDDTLKQIAKKVSSSYKIATSTAEVTSADFIYLINNGVNYDLYVLVEGNPTKVGDTSIDLSDYAKLTDLDNYYDKSTSDGKFATITTVDGKVDKTSILDAVDNTTTNEKVVGGKLFYDTIKDTHIKTYTELDQLGLSEGCTVEDIFLALPDNSYFEMGTIDLASTPHATYKFVANVPNEHSGFFLTIRKYTKARFDIRAKLSAGSIISRNELYIGQLKGNDGTGLVWNKVINDEELYIGREITEGLITSIYGYGNDILKYPEGRWDIRTSQIASLLTNIPTNEAGVLEISSIHDVDGNPYDTPWCHRIYKFEPYDGGLYIRTIQSNDTPGSMYVDTKWQRMATVSTLVPDVAVTDVTFTNSNVSKTGADEICKYCVKNGICYVTLNGLTFSSSYNSGEGFVNLPKPAMRQDFLLTDSYGTTVLGKLFLEVHGGMHLYTNTTPVPTSGFISFSYPIAES